MKSDFFLATPTVCPMCGQGELSQMVLMDTLSCPVCHHMFSWNDYQQRLEVLDISSPLNWRWTGRKWQRGPHSAQPFTSVTIIFSLIIVILPALMIEIASYIFPPLPGSHLAGFHAIWATAALTLHGAWVAWVMVESYHFSPYILAKVKTREFFQRLSARFS